MRKKYDVTEDMLKKLYEGQEFKNFTELSTYLGVLDDNGKPLTSDSRKQFMEELDRFVEYRHEPRKQKITIERIRPSLEIKLPRPTSGRAGKYSPLIQKVLAFQILRILDEWKYTSATLICEEDDIFRACGMINQNFAFYEKHSKEKDLPDQFRSLCRSKFKEYIRNALNAMQRNKELSWSLKPYKVVGQRPDCKISVLLKSEEDTFHRLEEEAFNAVRRNNKEKYKSRQEMFSSGKGEIYYDTLNKLVMKEFATPEEREKDIYVRIWNFYRIRVTPKNAERLYIRANAVPDPVPEFYIPDPAPFREFNELSENIYTYVKTSTKIKGKKTTAQRNPNKKTVPKEWGGGVNKMLPDFYYFRKSLTQEQVDKFADAMIKQPKPAVKKYDDGGLGLPHLNFALIYNFAPDDDEEVVAEAQTMAKPVDSSPKVPEKPAESVSAVEQPEDDVDISSNADCQKEIDFLKQVALYHNHQRNIQNNKPKDIPEEIDISSIIDEI